MINKFCQCPVSSPPHVHPCFCIHLWQHYAFNNSIGRWWLKTCHSSWKCLQRTCCHSVGDDVTPRYTRGLIYDRVLIRYHPLPGQGEDQALHLARADPSVQMNQTQSRRNESIFKCVRLSLAQFWPILFYLILFH